MSRSHSYAQIPVSEAQEDTHAADTITASPAQPAQPSTNSPFTLPRFPSSSNGYARIQDEEDLEELDQDNVLLRPLATSSPSFTAQQPALHSEIAIESAAEPSSSSGRVAPTAGPSRPQFPAAAGARRMIQQTMDGVFSNLSAKPRVEQAAVEELPPPYKAAALDQSPAYYETTVLSPLYSEDEVLVDGLPVGGLVGFVWNMMISTSFQFVGFFLTYLLHTSHATKNGSKMGLGITFVSIGMQMMSGKGDDQDTQEDSDTGYMGNTSDGMQSAQELMGLSYVMVILGFAIMLHSSLEFVRAKRTEMVINATSSSQAAEADTVNSSVV